MEKETKVVLLPTQRKSKIYKSLLTDKLFKVNNDLTDLSESSIEYQELYFISNEEVNVNDYYLSADNRILQWKQKIEDFVISHNKIFKANNIKPNKIIATTDTSLCFNEEDSKNINRIFVPDYLPQPSQEFINTYIEKYNKNEIIDGNAYEFIINNTINISLKEKGITSLKLKELSDELDKILEKEDEESLIKFLNSYIEEEKVVEQFYTKEEVINLFSSYQHYWAQMILKGENDNKQNPIEWIKENLK